MSLFDKVSKDIQEAMKAGQKVRLEALRAIKTAFILAKTETGAAELPPDQELKILQKMIKQRRESADIYKAQNRMDLYQQEADEVSVIEQYLPGQLSEAEVTAILQRILVQVGATSPKDMGKVMAAAGKELSGKADNRMVAEKVKEMLSAN